MLRFFMIILVIIVASCSKEKKQTKEQKPQAAKPKNVLVREIKPQVIEEFTSLSGTVEAVIDVNMTAEISGKLIKVYKHLGDEVKKGETIAAIDTDDLEIEKEQLLANLTAQKASLELNQNQFNTSQKLYKSGDISESEFVQNRVSLEKIKAAIKGVEASLKKINRKLENAVFKAPVSGYISEIDLKEGEYLNAGKFVCSIVDPSELKIKTGVGESEISFLKKGQKVLISHPNLSEAIEGEICGIGLKPTRNQRTYPLEIKFKNDKILPGMVVNIKVVSKIYQNVLLVKTDEVLESFDRKFVFTVNSGKAQKKQLKIYKKIRDSYLVKAGLAIGDSLIYDGFSDLENESRIKIIK